MTYGLINPIFVALPRVFFYVHPYLRLRVNRQWCFMLEFFSFWAILFNAPGTLWLHQAGIQYDRLLHLSAGVITTATIAVLLVPFFARLPASKMKKIVLSATFTFACFGIFLWEGIQYTSDRLLGSRLFYDVTQNIRQDFLEDIFFGFLGILVGVALLRQKFPMMSAKLLQAR
jgi:hypothetical protein